MNKKTYNVENVENLKRNNGKLINAIDSDASHRAGIGLNNFLNSKIEQDRKNFFFWQDFVVNEVNSTPFYLVPSTIRVKGYEERVSPFDNTKFEFKVQKDGVYLFFADLFLRKTPPAIYFTFDVTLEIEINGIAEVFGKSTVYGTAVENVFVSGFTLRPLVIGDVVMFRLVTASAPAPLYLLSPSVGNIYGLLLSY